MMPPRCRGSLWPTSGLLDEHTFCAHVRREVAFADAWETNHIDTEVDDDWALDLCPSSAARTATVDGSN
jgi:hypothetical protein